MKYQALRSAAHNIADSLCSGWSELLGFFDRGDWANEFRSSSGYIQVDLVRGLLLEGHPSETLTLACSRVPEALLTLLGSDRFLLDEIVSLEARLSTNRSGFVITLLDKSGTVYVDEYIGISGARPKLADQLGRVRKSRGNALLPPARSK